ncbi:MAG: helicase-associated domain-containing protein [Gemmataceae bacterium]|nr:helicase-associated domain-containing protein [Gemmataceae bacterium]
MTTADLLRPAFSRYGEPLLRQVAARLARPRGQWPLDDLIDKCAEAIDNPPVLDRRLGELAEPGRRLLAMMGRSRQMDWALGNAIELLLALGHEDGVKGVIDLLESGLLLPDLSTVSGKINDFAVWMTTTEAAGLRVSTLPAIASRLGQVEFGLPDLADDAELEPVPPGAAALEADGLEWPLRLGALWQRLAESPLRRTQGGGLFKRDVDRVEGDALLNIAPADAIAPLPDIGFFLLELAEEAGVVAAGDGELKAGALPPEWEAGLAEAVEHLLPALFRLRSWNPLDGWKGGEPIPGNPYPSAFLLALLLLAKQPPDAWLRPATVQDWLRDHHPYWRNESLRPSQKRPWAEAFLLGVCWPLKLVQAAKDTGGGLHVRLSAHGRWLLAGAEKPAPPAVFPKTLTVQPNLEIIAFRQGLTPSLVGRLTRMASWKSLGAACALALEPETVYRALEAGESFETLSGALDKHGTRAVPQAVLDSLRTWSAKRDRITVYPAAALLEFATARELEQALARGVPGTRIGETLLVVANEDQIDFKHFKLAGNRDYAGTPERCVSVEDDGVTLAVDLAKSDLMLETELPRFADLLDRVPVAGKRLYRLTPASMARARQSGWTLPLLENWFQQRTGVAATAAARLLLTAAAQPAPRLERHLVLRTETPEMADGLEQWPATRALVALRLGPTALAVREEDRAALEEQLAALGVAGAE